MSEELWKAIRLLGISTKEERLDFLRQMLGSDYAGTRNAAASALGNLGDTVPLVEQLREEPNRFVRSTIEAHLRTLLTSTPADAAGGST